MVVQNTKFFYLVFQVCTLWFISGWLQSLSSNVKMSHCCVPWFFKIFLMRFSVRPDKVLSKPCLFSFRRLAVVGLKSATCNYCAIYGLFVWARMLFTTVSDCCVSRGTSHIPVSCSWCLLLFIVCYYWLTYLACLLWWCIHHHIRLIMILVGMFSFLGDCGFT